MRPKSKVRYVNHDLWAVMERARKQIPMSALGQKRTFSQVQMMSALPPKADISHREDRLQGYADSRYGSKASIETWTVGSASGPHSSLPVTMIACLPTPNSV